MTSLISNSKKTITSLEDLARREYKLFSDVFPVLKHYIDVCAFLRYRLETSLYQIGEGRHA